MTRASYPLALYRGDSFDRIFRFWLDADKTQPADLTGVSVAASIRASGGTIPLACEVIPPNEIAVSLAAGAWGGLTSGSGSWDLQFTYADGRVFTPIAGPVAIVGDVTGASV